MFITPGEQGRPFDIFHDEVGLSGRRGAPVEQSRDAWMFKLSEDLPFPAETLGQVRITAGAGDQFDGDSLVIFAVGAVGEIDDSHASASNLIKDRVGADL